MKPLLVAAIALGLPAAALAQTSPPAGSPRLPLATSVPVRWFGIRWAVLPNQKFEIWQSISPLPGIGSGSTTSKAESRSLATISRRPEPSGPGGRS